MRPAGKWIRRGKIGRRGAEEEKSWKIRGSEGEGEKKAAAEEETEEKEEKQKIEWRNHRKTMANGSSSSLFLWLSVIMFLPRKEEGPLGSFGFTLDEGGTSMDKKAMYKMTYGLFVLTTNVDGKDYGCIINTAIQVSSDPNRISIAVNKANYTHDLILQTRKFTVSAISEEACFDLFKRFGFQSGRDVDKFAGFDAISRGYNGCPIITEGTNAFFSGWVEQTVDLGSHTLFIAPVTDMEVLSKAASCSYAYYQDNIKPKPQPVGKTADGKTIWRCRICGYEYVGEEIPEDFICPICKHPASDFEKVTG